MPKARKMAQASQAGFVTAKPKAAPIKGAVQGLATTTVKMPTPKVDQGPEEGRAFAARESAK